MSMLALHVSLCRKQQPSRPARSWTSSLCETRSCRIERNSKGPQGMKASELYTYDGIPLSELQRVRYMRELPHEGLLRDRIVEGHVAHREAFFLPIAYDDRVEIRRVRGDNEMRRFLRGCGPAVPGELHHVDFRFVLGACGL